MKKKLRMLVIVFLFIQIIENIKNRIFEYRKIFFYCYTYKQYFSDT